MAGLRNGRPCDTQDGDIVWFGSRAPRRGWVLVAVCGVAMVKVGVARAYALFAAKETRLGFNGQLARMQLKIPLPFAVAEGLFALRVQADQWGLAANFSNTAYRLRRLFWSSEVDPQPSEGCSSAQYQYPPFPGVTGALNAGAEDSRLRSHNFADQRARSSSDVLSRSRSAYFSLHCTVFFSRPHTLACFAGSTIPQHNA